MTEAPENKMTYTFFKLFLLIMAIVTMTPLHVNAQFYDSENDICFYVNSQDPRYCIVINFDGNKATYFNHTYFFSVQTVQNKLNEDPDHFEKRVYTANYNMNYTGEFSGVAYHFQEHRNGIYGLNTDSYVMEFSNDRNTLNYKCYPQCANPSSSIKPSKIESYKRVPKEYFITQRRGRSSNNNTGIIYE